MKKYYSSLPTLIFIFVISSGGAQTACSMGKYIHKAGKWSVPLVSTITDATTECSNNSKLDSIDHIMLLYGIPEVTPKKGATSEMDSKKIEDAYTNTYNKMANIGASKGEAMAAAGNAQGYEIAGQSSAGLFFLFSLPVGGKTPKGQSKDERKDIARFHIFYAQGKWNNAVNIMEHSEPGAPALLKARAIRKALEDGTIVTWDAPKQLMNKKGFANEALKYYQEALISLDKLPLSSTMKQKVRQEADDWKKQVESGKKIARKS
jgi:hypothetical protein